MGELERGRQRAVFVIGVLILVGAILALVVLNTF